MKLNYKILWLDDKIQDFIDDEVIEEIENHLIEQNFVPQIDTVKNSTEFFEKLDGSYDLILTDYHMNDINGDKVIEKLRGEEYSVMTEVLFYTAKADLKDTQKISRISFLETNSLSGSHIDNVIDKTIKLIDLTIKKFQHIVAMRGMIMHETSSLDAQTFEMADNYLRSNDDEVRITLFDELISFFESKLKSSSKNKKNNNVNNILRDPLLLSSAQRANVLSSIIKIKGYENFISDFKTEIINVRNQFAHAVLEKDDDGNNVFRNKKEDIVFNEEYSKEIRKNIIKHKNNLDSLEEKLNDVTI